MEWPGAVFSLETEENLHVMMWDVIGLVKLQVLPLKSSAMIQEVATWVWRRASLQEEMPYIKQPLSSLAVHQNHLGALKNLNVHSIPGPVESVSGEGPRYQYFCKFPKWFPCATRFENMGYSPKESGCGLSIRVLKSLWDGSYDNYCYIQ